MELDEEKVIKVIGIGRRLGAAVIDGFFITLFTFLLVAAITIVGTFLGSYSPAERQLPWDTLIIICGLLFSVAYYAWFWVRSGQTIGKAVLGIKVITKNGTRLTWGKALLRYVGYLISAIPLSLGFLWVSFDRRRQGWHDKIAGTYVIYQEKEFTRSDLVEFVPSDPRRSWIWIVLYVLIAVSVPAALSLSLWFLGPFINGIATDLIQNHAPPRKKR